MNLPSPPKLLSSDSSSIEGVMMDLWCCQDLPEGTNVRQLATECGELEMKGTGLEEECNQLMALIHMHKKVVKQWSAEWKVSTDMVRRA
jgi:hypothetical protein